MWPSRRSLRPERRERQAEPARTSVSTSTFVNPVQRQAAQRRTALHLIGRMAGQRLPRRGSECGSPGRWPCDWPNATRAAGGRASRCRRAHRTRSTAAAHGESLRVGDASLRRRMIAASPRRLITRRPSRGMRGAARRSWLASTDRTGPRTSLPPGREPVPGKPARRRRGRRRRRHHAAGVNPPRGRIPAAAAPARRRAQHARGRRHVRRDAVGRRPRSSGRSTRRHPDHACTRATGGDRAPATGGDRAPVSADRGVVSIAAAAPPASGR